MVPETAAHTNSFNELSHRFDLACQTLAAVALGQKKDNVTEIVKQIVSTLELKHISYVRFDAKRSEDVILLAALVTYPMHWQLRYFHRSYHEVDQVCIIGLTASLPFDWRAFRNSSPKTSAFLADAASHGIGVIPVRNKPNAVALMSFTSDLADPEWDEYMRRYMGKLQTLACLIDTASTIRTRLPSNTIVLTRREEQALAWEALGRTANDTANIMNLLYATVKTYLESPRHKLGCANVTGEGVGLLEKRVGMHPA